ncbi:MAG: DNA-3-methyladenine glycosylase I [Acidimicrobiales bacterium]
MSVVTGADGVVRCWWCGEDPTYVAYHDDEWGQPLRDERSLFELLCLEAFQAGLSWITILRKRGAFREGFERFEPSAVAEYGATDIDRLLGDAGIVRHRGKIEATIANAQAVETLRAEGSSLVELLWSYAPAPRPSPLADREAIPAHTPESATLAKVLKQRGFRFMGPTTTYALMQSAGLVDDHLVGCHRAALR